MALQKVIRERLSEYQLRNPAFSMRAFSMRLGTTPATLSRVLAGKRRLSKGLAARIVDKLNLSPEESQQIMALFPKKKMCAQNSNTADDFTILTMDHFHVISDWHYFAIRALLRTEGAQSSSEWIASRLGISITDARQSIERLERLEMIVRDPSNCLRPTEVQFHSPDGVADTFVRRNHAQHLDLARLSLDIDPVELRDFTNLTFAIDTNQLPKARSAIRRFRKEMMEILDSGQKKEVYKLAIQMFPVSRNQIQKKTKTKEEKSI